MKEFDFLTEAIEIFSEKEVLNGIQFNGSQVESKSVQRKTPVTAKKCKEFMTIVKQNVSNQPVIRLFEEDPRDEDVYIYLEMFPNLNSFSIRSEY